MNKLLLKASVYLELARSRKIFITLILDFSLLFAAIYLAYYLRLGSNFSPSLWQIVLFSFFALIAIASFMGFGVYRQVVRFAGEELTSSLIKGISLSVSIWVVFVYLTKSHEMGNEGAPRSIPFIMWAFAFFGVYTTRRLMRWLYWRLQTKGKKKPLLLYGTGNAGFAMARALEHESGYEIVAVVDQAPDKVGQFFQGRRIFPIDAIPDLIEKYGIADCIVAVDKTGTDEVSKALLVLEANKVHPRILPPIYNIASGKNLVNLVREVNIEDLLGRESVLPVETLIQKCVGNRVVMVTGAGGSIGTELCRQIVRYQAKKLILFEQSEPSLYEVHRKLLPLGEVELIPVIGSITNFELLHKTVKMHTPQVIFHAAAHKHVPLVEDNVEEGYRNNVEGTINALKAALCEDIERFVMISTDKAVRPTNVMGSTKRWAEIAVQNAQLEAKTSGKRTIFCAVRFGNVLGSSGSVIPLFKEQISAGGPVTVTDPQVTRFFMSIEEASQLVIQAGALAEGGDVFLLDMGAPVKIIDLAINMIRLAGLEPIDPQTGEGDIEIKFIGMRPGEKLYEELLIESHNALKTEHPKIMRGKEPYPSKAVFEANLEELRSALASGDIESARAKLLNLANTTAH